MKRILLAAASAAGVLTLAACGSSGGSAQHSSSSGMSSGSMSSGMAMPGGSTSAAGSPASGPHNSADVAFATDMIPHHAQAIEMADMALAKATNSQVRTYATTINAAQAPEIATMSGWLAGWSSPVPSTSMDPSMPGMTMPGMMSAADMQTLNKTTGPAFDKLWIQMMIQHHSGAITMAKTELTQGQNAQAKSLAQSIITGQGSEITQFRKLLPTLGS